MNEVIFRTLPDDLWYMWYLILLVCLLLLIKLSDSKEFFKIVGIGRSDISYSKKILAPVEKIKGQNLLTFLFRGLTFSFFVFLLTKESGVLAGHNISIYFIFFVWFAYSTIRLLLEVITGLLWKSIRLFLQLISRRALLKSKAAFVLFIFLLFGSYEPLQHLIYWSIVGFIYILYYLFGYQSYAASYSPLIRKKFLLFILYICALEIIPLWIAFDLANQWTINNVL